MRGRASGNFPYKASARIWLTGTGQSSFRAATSGRGQLPARCIWSRLRDALTPVQSSQLLGHAAAGSQSHRHAASSDLPPFFLLSLLRDISVFTAQGKRRLHSFESCVTPDVHLTQHTAGASRGVSSGF